MAGQAITTWRPLGGTVEVLSVNLILPPHPESFPLAHPPASARFSFALLGESASFRSDLVRITSSTLFISQKCFHTKRVLNYVNAYAFAKGKENPFDPRDAECLSGCAKTLHNFIEASHSDCLCEKLAQSKCMRGNVNKSENSVAKVRFVDLCQIIHAATLVQVPWVRVVPDHFCIFPSSRLKDRGHARKKNETRNHARFNNSEP